VYRVHELTEGAFHHNFWHKISITKCPYLKICQLSVGESRSVVPFLAPQKTASKMHSLTCIVGMQLRFSEG
jgi:hypothetical protein